MVPVKYFHKWQTVLRKQVQVFTAMLLIGHAMLYKFSSRQHIGNWTRSEQVRSKHGLLENIAASLSVAGS